jgi:ketosteroid isomerase-like protein
METSTELVDLVHAWFAGASAGDASLVDLIGSDPEEWLQGGPEIVAFLKGEVEGGGGQVTFTPSETEAFAAGDVGWAATRLTIALPDGGHISPRWTSVLVREDGAWRFVQTHASLAVANDDAGWTYD